MFLVQIWYSDVKMEEDKLTTALKDMLKKHNAHGKVISISAGEVNYHYDAFIVILGNRQSDKARAASLIAENLDIGEQKPVLVLCGTPRDGGALLELFHPRLIDASWFHHFCGTEITAPLLAQLVDLTEKSLFPES
ncbi:MAG: hypothetical protein Q7S16_00315 [bacterium]|nr:hypothetical protein [bacterium]